MLAVREATKWAADYCRAWKVGGAVMRGGEGGWDCIAMQEGELGYTVE